MVQLNKQLLKNETQFSEELRSKSKTQSSKIRQLIIQRVCILEADIKANASINLIWDQT